MTLEQQLQASIDLLERSKRLPTETELAAVHAQLERLIRERVRVWRRA